MCVTVIIHTKYQLWVYECNRVRKLLKIPRNGGCIYAIRFELQYVLAWTQKCPLQLNVCLGSDSWEAFGNQMTYMYMTIDYQTVNECRNAAFDRLGASQPYFQVA